MGNPITDEDLERFGNKLDGVKKIYLGIHLTFLGLILFLFTYFFIE
jgi:hypothetical protein